MSSEMKTTLSDQELVNHCDFLIKDFCKNGFKSGHWTMRIPAEPNRDPDLVFSELIDRFNVVRSKSSNSDYEKCHKDEFENIICDIESSIHADNETSKSILKKSLHSVKSYIHKHFA